MIEYPIGDSGQIVVFETEALRKFRKHRQRRPWQLESGGQLFARFEAHRIVVSDASGPRPTDKRTRTSYVPDRRAERQEIVERHGQGLHYVGDWHTHREKVPTPSFIDSASIAECVRKSTHLLNGFLLVVVGQADPPGGLHVRVHDGHHGYLLQGSTAKEDGRLVVL